MININFGRVWCLNESNLFSDENGKGQLQSRRARPAAELLSLLAPKKVIKERAWLSPDLSSAEDWSVFLPMLLSAWQERFVGYNTILNPIASLEQRCAM